MREADQEVGDCHVPCSCTPTTMKATKKARDRVSRLYASISIILPTSKSYLIRVNIEGQEQTFGVFTDISLAIYPTNLFARSFSLNGSSMATMT